MSLPAFELFDYVWVNKNTGPALHDIVDMYEVRGVWYYSLRYLPGAYTENELKPARKNSADGASKRGAQAEAMEDFANSLPADKDMRVTYQHVADLARVRARILRGE